MRGTACRDVMVLMNPRNPEPFRLFMRTKLYQTYTSVLFTRNPNMFVPSMQNGEPSQRCLWRSTVLAALHAVPPC
jgi:hypothetical protein